MISLSLEGIAGAQRAFEALAKEQLPYAQMTAINDVAFKVKRAEQDEMRRVFDKPTPWLIRQVAVRKATKTDLTAVIGTPEGIQDARGQAAGFGRSSSGVFERILSPHISGGQRAAKGGEYRLRKAGILPEGWYVVPGRGATLDQYGNLSGPWWMMILSWLNAGQWSSQGAIQNRAEKASKRRNKLERQGYDLFAVTPNSQRRGLRPGVYLRKGTLLKSILIFVPKAVYRQRLDWYGVFDRTVRAELPDAAMKAVQRAIATAR